MKYPKLKASHVVLLGIMGIGIFLPFTLIAGGILGYMARSWAVFALVALGSPFVFAMMRVGSLNARTRRYADKAMNALDKVDYWFGSNMGAIALDLGNQTFALMSKPRGTGRKPKLRKIKASDIKGWTVYQGQAAVYSRVGSAGPSARGQLADTLADHDALVANQVAIAHANNNTGLTLKTQALENHERFVQMGVDQAKSWANLLEHLAAGKLEPQDKPKLFPETYRI